MMRRHAEAMRVLQSGNRVLFHDIEKSALGRFGMAIDEIHYLSLMLADDSGMRFFDKVPYRGRMPVISARQAGSIIHSLLHHGPFAVGRHYESMEINLEAVRDCVVVDS